MSATFFLSLLSRLRLHTRSVRNHFICFMFLIRSLSPLPSNRDAVNISIPALNLSIRISTTVTSDRSSSANIRIFAPQALSEKVWACSLSAHAIGLQCRFYTLIALLCSCSGMLSRRLLCFFDISCLDDDKIQ